MAELLVFDHTPTVSRWWVVRRGDVAASLTAAFIPDGTPPLRSEVRTADGDRLYPGHMDIHRRGIDDPDCPALAGGCGGGGIAMAGNPRRVMKAWVEAGHDDQVIAAALAEMEGDTAQLVTAVLTPDDPALPGDGA
jgi:hypothetical protein